MSIEVWGLIVSILGILVTLGMWRYMYKNDNSFKMKVFPDNKSPIQCLFSNNEKTAIELKVITQNIGRQGVVITDVVVCEAHEDGSNLASNLNDRPRTLQSDEFITLIYKRAVVPGISVNLGSWPGFPPNIKHIFALDSRGRKWEMKESDVTTINDTINKIINKNETQQ